MPPVIAAIPVALAAGAGAGATAAIGGATLGAVLQAAAISGAVSLGVGTVANMLSGSSRATVSGEQPLHLLASQDSDEARVWGYGIVTAGGREKFRQTTGADNKTLWRVYAYHDTPITEFLGLYLNGTLENFSGSDATGAYAGVLSVYDHLGALNQTADADLVAASGGTWTSDHRLLGIAYDVSKHTYDQAKYAAGIPNRMRRFKARKIWDPRKDPDYGGSGAHRLANEATWEWSANASLCTLDYVMGVRLNGTLIGGLGIPISGIDLPSVVAAANICDESVSLSGGGSESRYAVNGMVSSLEDKTSVFSSLLQAMAGELAIRNGRVGWLAGAAVTATVTLTDDDLHGGITVRPSKSLQDKINGITGIYYDALANNGTASVPPLTVPEYVTADGGVTLERDVRHRFTASSPTAQRINKIILANAREQLTIEATWKPKAAPIPLNGTFLWTSAALGYTAQKMRVMNRRRMPDGSFWILARQETDAKYSWAAEEQAAPSFQTHTGFDPGAVTAPSAADINIVPITRAGAYGETVPVFRVQVATPANTFIREILVEWRQTGETVWHAAPSIIPDFAASYSYGAITGLAPGSGHSVRVAYRTAAGTSGWTELSEVIAPVTTSVDYYVRDLLSSINRRFDEIGAVLVSQQWETYHVIPGSISASVRHEESLRITQDAALAQDVATVTATANDATAEGLFRIRATAGTGGAAVNLSFEARTEIGGEFESASLEIGVGAPGGSVIRAQADFFLIDGTLLNNGALITDMLAAASVTRKTVTGLDTAETAAAASSAWTLLKSLSVTVDDTGSDLDIDVACDIKATDSNHLYAFAVTYDSTDPETTPLYNSLIGGGPVFDIGASGTWRNWARHLDKAGVTAGAHTIRLYGKADSTAIYFLNKDIRVTEIKR